VEQVNLLFATGTSPSRDIQLLSIGISEISALRFLESSRNETTTSGALGSAGIVP